jgi:hypothetical protein
MWDFSRIHGILGRIDYAKRPTANSCALYAKKHRGFWWISWENKGEKAMDK